MQVDMNEYYKQAQMQQIMSIVDVLRREVTDLKRRVDELSVKSLEDKAVVEDVAVTVEKKKPGRPPKSEE